MKTTLILLSSLSMLIHPVIAEKAAQFGYGCGTGCRVSLINKVVDLDDGIGQATFQVLTRGGVGGRNYSSEVTYLANCSENLISCDGSSWLRIDLTDNDRYTTTQGGIGYYFDAICQPNKTIQSLSATSCEDSIEFAKEKLGGVRSVKRNKIDPTYIEFPKAKPYELSIIQRIGTSPSYQKDSLLIQVSKKILNTCPNIAYVTFYGQGDDYVTYGVVNGKVTAFECIMFDEKNRPKKAPWGFRFCAF